MCLRKEGERLKESVARLETLDEVARKAGESYENALVYQALLARRNLRDDERALEQAKLAVEDLNGKLATQNEFVLQLNGEKGGYQDGLVTIKAKLSGIPAANQKERLDDRAAQAQTALSGAVGELLVGVKQVQTLLAHSRQLVGLAVPNDFRGVRTAIGEVAEELSMLESLSADTWQAPWLPCNLPRTWTQCGRRLGCSMSCRPWQAALSRCMSVWRAPRTALSPQ